MVFFFYLVNNMRQGNLVENGYNLMDMEASHYFEVLLLCSADRNCDSWKQKKLYVKKQATMQCQR